jgi:hypothetical protein
MSPREYFDGLPRGEIKRAIHKLGYSHNHMLTVIAGKRNCSLHMAKCLVEYSGGLITLDAIRIGAEHTKTQRKQK